MSIGARVLIVDDEAAQTRALCETLQAAGYATTGFTNGEDALKALHESQFELLLTDLMMPGTDGITLLQSALAVDPDIAGIIMTGEGTIATAVDAMKAGAIDYILKPFKLSVVLPVLSRALAMRRLRIENALLQRRLCERAAELELANKDLEAFAYSVSHDLRSPLRAIDGYSHLIEERLGDKLDEVSQRLFDVMRDGSRRMNVLIDDMLAFSRFGRQAMALEQVDMASLVNEIWAELHAGSSCGAVKFAVDILPSAWGDRALLKQVWINLMSNAVKYSGKTDQPEIRVSGDEHDAEVVYCVRDNGVGFDMQYYAKLFEVFQRLHSETHFPGTGVGLAIVQRIVTRHGGRVWAEGKVNAGATFFFSLPRSRTNVRSQHHAVAGGDEKVGE